MYAGDEIGTGYDKQINSFRQRFERVLTEDSGGPGSPHPHPTAQPPLHAAPPAVNGHPGTMAGGCNAYDMDEKDYVRKTREDEKTISALV